MDQDQELESKWLRLLQNVFQKLKYPSENFIKYISLISFNLLKNNQLYFVPFA